MEHLTYYINIYILVIFYIITFIELYNSNFKINSFWQVLVIVLSVLLLGDDLSGLSAVGCALSMLGSAWYGYVSLNSRELEEMRKT